MHIKMLRPTTSKLVTSTIHLKLLKLLLLISCLASDVTADDDNMAGSNGDSHGTAIEVYQDDMRSTPASTGKYSKKQLGVSETAHQTGGIVTLETLSCELMIWPSQAHIQGGSNYGIFKAEAECSKMLTLQYHVCTWHHHAALSHCTVTHLID